MHRKTPLHFLLQLIPTPFHAPFGEFPSPACAPTSMSPTKEPSMNTKDDAPLPKRSEEDHHFTNDGGKVWRESGTRPFTIDHKQAKGKEGTPWQPNDQDEAVDGTQQ